MPQNQATSLEGSNLPPRYRLLGKYHPISYKIFGISIVIWLIATWLCLVMINVIRPEFNSHGFVTHLVDSLSEYSYRLKVIGFGLLTVLVTGFLHESAHGVFHWVFSKKRPNPEFTIHPYIMTCTSEETTERLLRRLCVVRPNVAGEF